MARSDTGLGGVTSAPTSSTSAGADTSGLVFSLDQATFQLGGRPVLSGVSWTTRVGEQWAVVGPNGAGKSLLLRGVSGQLIRGAGRLRHHFLEHDRRCRDSIYGILPHGSIELVSPETTRGLAREAASFHQARWHATVAHGARVADLVARESVERVNPFCVDDPALDRAAFERARGRAIERTELGPLLERCVAELSNGEVRRLALARALCREPKLLLMDDALTGLDVEYRGQLQGVLAGLTAEGTMIVLAARGPEEIPGWITHVLRLEDGRVVHTGPRAEAPEHASAALRSPPSRPAPPPAVVGEPLVELRGASVRYGETVLLDRIDWTVRRGEHWAVVGPNGAGKTTLLSLIVGDNPQAFANDVRILGRRRGSGENIWELRARIGWLGPELDVYFPPHAACFDAVASGFDGTFGRSLAASRDQRQRVSELLDMFGLGRHGQTPLAQLDDAERRLAFLARALVHSPELLVLDEPCQGLDGARQALVRRALDLALCSGAGSLIYVTHDQSELPECVNHVLVLERGRVVSARPRIAEPAPFRAGGDGPSV